uniref:Uncharacterized protein n=1 Tax=Siphoviridae sp. ctBLh2 TaxID=2827803 RepID=A0A8S5S3W4_9CAUD|nr:MAG TPA: hypothetical protein [Siphoviridae sp. ctBLh2]
MRPSGLARFRLPDPARPVPVLREGRLSAAVVPAGSARASKKGVPQSMRHPLSRCTARSGFISC